MAWCRRRPFTAANLTERARQIHKTLPVATAALGRTLAAASMMGNALKGQGASLTLQIKGGGPLGTVLAVSDQRGQCPRLCDEPPGGPAPAAGRQAGRGRRRGP